MKYIFNNWVAGAIAFRSSPIVALHVKSNVLPLNLRRELLSLKVLPLYLVFM